MRRHLVPRSDLHDHTGRRFGKWTALRHVMKDEQRAMGFTVWEGGPSRWLCRCDCGTEALVSACHLVSGRSESCRPCGTKFVRERVCRWCQRPTDFMKGTRTPQECPACNKRAWRNGRDEDGRPLYKKPGSKHRRVAS